MEECFEVARGPGEVLPHDKIRRFVEAAPSLLLGLSTLQIIKHGHSKYKVTHGWSTVC